MSYYKHGETVGKEYSGGFTNNLKQARILRNNLELKLNRHE